MCVYTTFTAVTTGVQAHFCFSVCNFFRLKQNCGSHSHSVQFMKTTNTFSVTGAHTTVAAEDVCRFQFLNIRASICFHFYLE